MNENTLRQGQQGQQGQQSQQGQLRQNQRQQAQGQNQQVQELQQEKERPERGGRPGDIRCQADLAYPPVRAEGRNPSYARAMLDNQSGVNSEMSAVSLYFYNHLITTGDEEVALVFHKISIVEMHHLEIFGTLALQLGENPRLWTQTARGKSYWSPAYNQYPTRMDQLLLHAVASERQAIEKYQSQLNWIQDSNVRENLKRIVADEELHVKILTELYLRGKSNHLVF